VSHAHSDHLPSGYSKNKIMCSEITRRIIELKKKKEIKLEYKNAKIKMLDAGHILGSKMFLVNNKLLYTGDFNTKGGYCGKAEPVKCKTLIIESTFGLPQFVFPDRKEVIEELADYVRSHEKVIISTSDSGFGKPQEMCSILNKHQIPFNTDLKTKMVNSHLNLDFKYFDESSKIVVASSLNIPNYSLDYKRVILTGWAMNPWKIGSSVDQSFVFSSHCDYPSLIDFVEKCRPEKIFTHHGYAQEFALDLRKRGFNAAPLSVLTGNKERRSRKKVQKTIFDFY
jgi:Cft2 family RNA processing exonuclease